MVASAGRMGPSAVLINDSAGLTPSVGLTITGGGSTVAAFWELTGITGIGGRIAKG